MRCIVKTARVSAALLLLTACASGNQSGSLTPSAPNGSVMTANGGVASPDHHRHRGCTTIRDSRGHRYTVAQVGGGNQLTIDARCDIGMYVSAKYGPATLNQITVTGRYRIGVYLDGVGNSTINQTSICVDGAGQGNTCVVGRRKSGGTGLYVRSTSNLTINQTSIDGYRAGFATLRCPSDSNNMTVNQTTITRARYPWSVRGGNVKFNNVSPAPRGNGSCRGSKVGAGRKPFFGH